MKKIFSFLLALFIWNSASVDAQVAIGDMTTIRDGILLDLKTTGSLGGLALPQVELTDVTVWAPLGDAQSDAVNGMVVFNTNSSSINGLLGKGVYIWDTDRWKLISSASIGATLVTSITISGNDRVDLDQSITLTTSVLPVSATNKGIVWSASPSDAVEFSNGGSTEVTVKGIKAENVTIIATAIDGSFVFGTFMLQVVGPFTCNLDSTPGSVKGVSGYEYKTYAYNTGISGTAECWMIENSHEGYYEDGFGFYDGNPAKSNGAYYRWEQANAKGNNNPCPPGWSLPVKSQFDKLATIINADPTNSGKWWIGSPGESNDAFAGANLGDISSWSNYRWHDYNVVGYWWASTNNVSNAEGDFLYSNSTVNSAETNKTIAVWPLSSYNQFAHLSVRCVRQQ